MNYKKTLKKLLVTVITLSLVFAFINSTKSYAGVQEGDNVIPSDSNWTSFSVRDDLHTGVNTEWENALLQSIDKEKRQVYNQYATGKITEQEYNYLIEEIDNWQSITHGKISGENNSSSVTLDCSKAINGNTGHDAEYASVTQGGEKILVGDNPWGLTLDMKEIPVQFGRTYTMEFDIASDLCNSNNQRSDKHALVKACDYQSRGEPSAQYSSVYVDGYDSSKDGIFTIKKTPKGSSELVKTHIQASFKIPDTKNDWSGGKDSGANTYMGIKFALGAFSKTYPEEDDLQGKIYISNMKVIAGPEVPFNPETDPVVVKGPWDSFFGASDTEFFFEGSEGSLTNNTNNAFTADIARVGWGGVYGCQVSKSVNIVKEKEYGVNFTINSSKTNKYVYFLVGDASNPAFSKWIYLPVGKTITVDEKFIARENASKVYFALGGETGEREMTDEDALYRYSLFDQQFGFSYKDLVNIDCDGDFSSATKIEVIFNNYFDQNGVQPPTTNNTNNTDNTSNKLVNNKRTSIKKIASNKKALKVSWKKVSGVNGYQLQYGKKKTMKGAKSVVIKKATTTSKTIKKLNKKKKYYVRIRTFILRNNKSIYSAWSAIKAKKTK